MKRFTDGSNIYHRMVVRSAKAQTIDSSDSNFDTWA